MVRIQSTVIPPVEPANFNEWAVGISKDRIDLKYGKNAKVLFKGKL